MNIYFVIYLSLQLLGLGVELGKHGQPQKGKYNFWVTFIFRAMFTVLVYFSTKQGFEL